MARLIDAELLDYISFQATGEQRYDDGFGDGVLYIINKIDSSPTIPAIPVEWLEEQRDKRRAAAAAHSKIGGKSMNALESINAVLEMWNKEQEAK